MDVSRRLEAAIRRLRDAGDQDLYTLEAAREELNAVLDEAAYTRRPPSPAAVAGGGGGGVSGLRGSARRLNQVERQLDSLQQFNTLQEEIRWVDEEASQARRELEDRIEARIVAVEARVTALTAMSNETESRLKELERRADLQDAISKRSRLTIEELADKVSSVVSELQQRVITELNGERGREPVDFPLTSASASSSNGIASHRYSESLRPISRVPSGPPAKSEGMIRELMARVEALEQDIDGERDRSIRAVELVATALTPSRLRHGSGAPISPERPSASASRAGVRRMSLSGAQPAGSRRLNGDDYAGESPRTSRAFQ